jgi:carbon storage regulator
MLILSRKLGESIVIDGRVNVSVVRLDKDIVKIGIDAPRTVPVYRKELFDEIADANTGSIINDEREIQQPDHAEVG